jgi:UDP-N-acetyl-2-amino-2-deoxyglucuronate dehydrogenase
MDKPIKFALVGYGHIGKRHANMILNNSETELVAICDVDAFIERGPEVSGIPFFDSIDKLFSMSEPFDVLSVATPNHYHVAHALMGLENEKHVIIEKPMGLKAQDCKLIIDRSNLVGKKVFCVMQNRYSPPAKWLKSIIEKNLLGKIYLVQVNCYWNRDHNYYTGENWRGKIDEDGGTLFTQFSHFVDMIYWLFGDIENISARFNKFDANKKSEFEDSGIVMFDILNGGMGSINYTTSVWKKNMESSILVVGERGSVKIGGQYMNKLEYCAISDYDAPQLEDSEPSNDYGFFQGSAANHKFVYENVINVLKSNEKISTNAYDGFKVVEIIERIYQSNPFLKKNT